MPRQYAEEKLPCGGGRSPFALANGGSDEAADFAKEEAELKDTPTLLMCTGKVEIDPFKGSYYI